MEDQKKSVEDDLVSPSTLRSLSQSMIESGKMPSLETVLGAISETRKKYRQQILDTRKTPHDTGIAALASS